MNRIKELREELHITKAQVARDLNMAYTTYVNYEKEAREPNSEVLILVANYFNVSVDYLIGRTEFRSNHLNEVKDLKQSKLITNYNSLNEQGKTKLVDYSDDLVGSGNYVDAPKEKRA